MLLATREEIEHDTDPQHSNSALFGYVSGLPDPQFLQYVFSFRFHKIIRRAFFNEIEKRLDLDAGAVDAVSEALLSAIEGGANRSQDEALIRRLIPRMSMQMRGRAFRSLLSIGTRTTRSYLLRKSSPESTPGIEEAVFTAALQGSEDALVGIVYRWPPSLWTERAPDLFEAAARLPWLQRQIIFRSNDPDKFLDQNLIKDAVTELYVRARYRREASDALMDSAILTVSNEPVTYTGDDRVGLVAWCLGRYGKFDRLQRLPQSLQSMLKESSNGSSEQRYQVTA